MIIVFDTETNGKILDMKAPVEMLEYYPRITQLSWAIFNNDGELIKTENHLIKPDGWEIPKEQFFIDNGMSTERNEEYGVPLAGVMEKFINDTNECHTRISHNMTFDSRIVRAEMFRLGIENDFTSKKICTMMTTTSFCKLPGARGFKWPKLEELHEKLFGVKFDGAHDALNDVMACAKCFFELKRIGHYES